MKIHLNTQTANLLIWETRPHLRNTNNQIELYCSDELKEGDIVVGDYSENGVSTYEIKEILSKRDCKMKGKKHFIATTRWIKNPTSFFKYLDIDHMPKNFIKLVRG